MQANENETSTELIKRKIALSEQLTEPLEVSIDKFGLMTFFEHQSDEEEYVIVITQVDPDALGCAFSIQYLLNLWGHNEIDIVYAGKFAHPQNRSLANIYNLLEKMKKVKDFEFKNQKIVLVDSSKCTDIRIPWMNAENVICAIDHHRGCDVDNDGAYILIDDSVGACSTLFIELMLFYNSMPTEDSHIYLRTLLALGIYTDTKGLVSAHRRDREAYQILAQTISSETLNKLIDYPLPESHYSNLQYALAHMDRKHSQIIASVGMLKEEDGDDLSTISDYLIRMNGISLVIVWALIGDKVRISARNRSLSEPLHGFLQEKFGAQSGAKLSPSGVGEGGAYLDLKLSTWMSERTEKLIMEMISERIKEIVFG